MASASNLPSWAKNSAQLHSDRFLETFELDLMLVVCLGDFPRVHVPAIADIGHHDKVEKSSDGERDDKADRGHLPCGLSHRHVSRRLDCERGDFACFAGPLLSLSAPMKTHLDLAPTRGGTDALWHF
jgi:hypothetical protein